MAKHIVISRLYASSFSQRRKGAVIVACKSQARKAGHLMAPMGIIIVIYRLIRANLNPDLQIFRFGYIFAHGNKI